MNKINENVTITDPQLAQQYTNAQKQLNDLNAQENTLRQQINDINQKKIQISNVLSQIEQKSTAQQITTNQNQQNNEKQQPQQTQNTVTIAPQSQQTNESLLVKIVSDENDFNSILNSELDDLKDQMIYGVSHKLDQRIIDFILKKIDLVKSELKNDNEILSGPDIKNNNIKDKNITYFTNPLSANNFYDDNFEDNDFEDDNFEDNDFEDDNFEDNELEESYIDYEGENDENTEKDIIDEDNNYVFYVKITDYNNETFIGKIFKITPDGDWYQSVKIGENKIFDKVSYDSNYDEDDIIDYLINTYDEVEIIGSDEYNEYIDNFEDLNEENQGMVYGINPDSKLDPSETVDESDLEDEDEDEDELDENAFDPEQEINPYNTTDINPNDPDYFNNPQELTGEMDEDGMTGMNLSFN